MNRSVQTSLALLLLAIVCVPACATNSADAAKQGDEVVAYVLGEPITRAEVEERAAGGLKSLEQERYDLLRETIAQMAREMMISKEAAARGMSSEELVESEIQSKVAEPTPKEIADFYDLNKARIGDAKLEQVSDRIKQTIIKRRTAARATAFENKLRAKADFQLLLDPPRLEVPIPDSALSSGPADAAVTIVEFADYQCPYCRRAHLGLARLLADYREKVRYVFRDYTLPFHKRAVPAAVAARCANEQGKFWDYHNNLMEMNGDLSNKDLKERAEQVGVDAVEFAACLDTGKYESLIQAGFNDGNSLGVTGTPSYFINGRMLVGAVPYEELKEVVDEELARAARDKPKAEG